jgi:phenylalanyl-tRNA synthetase beta chain
LRVPLSWLREYVPLEMPLGELATRLSVASAEIEGFEQRGVADENGNLDLFRVGRVVDAVKHPNADRLQLTKVDVGEGEPRSIVCGAWNFGVGATVGVALPGAVLPNGLTLEQRKVRGELSDGMILAEDEVGLGTDHAGIMVLPDAEPGTPLRDVLPLVDTVMLVESTGNRPDLQSIHGIAREVAALYDLPLAAAAVESPLRGLTPSQAVHIRIDDFGGCPRYIGRRFEGVAIGPSPVWLRARLFAAGMRPISNVVDVTNYVMLALGSPLHAFDSTTLREQRIVVRRAAPGEHIRTLDGTDRELDATDLVIADAERPVAIAGIMGGEETEIGEGTSTVLLEAANFDPFTIYRSSERHRLRSEASTRWEKGVDPYAAEIAADLATSLILELAGGELTAAADVHDSLPERPVIAYRPERADALIGVATAPDEQYALLGRLGFDRDGGNVIVPTWRARDVVREVDVIEEVARFRLEDVPFTLPARREMVGLLTREQQLRRRVEDALVGLGFAETYTPSLVPDDETTWKLPEPISVELTALRTTIVPSLVDAARRNADAGARAIALFEIARVYLQGGDLPEERLRVAGLAQGGFLHAKGVVEALYATLKAQPAFERAEHPLLHPGKTARTPAGVVGELHPRLLDGEWGAFELDLADLFAASHEPVIYEDFITYPAIRQDIAVSVTEEAPVGDLVTAAREAAGDELVEIRVFDVYRGEQVGAGRKSVALALTFQSHERTLTDDDATRLRSAIVAELERRLGAELRA